MSETAQPDPGAPSSSCSVGRVGILAGGGIRPHTVAALIDGTGGRA